jgi:hypothetical protein
MHLEEFKRLLSEKEPPPGCGPLLKALWHESNGDWQRAHEIVQDLDGREAARVHAYLHRREGDLPNAGYWDRRAGSGSKTAYASLEQEWEVLAADFLGGRFK